MQRGGVSAHVEPLALLFYTLSNPNEDVHISSQENACFLPETHSCAMPIHLGRGTVGRGAALLKGFGLRHPEGIKLLV